MFWFHKIEEKRAAAKAAATKGGKHRAAKPEPKVKAKDVKPEPKAKAPKAKEPKPVTDQELREFMAEMVRAIREDKAERAAAAKAEAKAKAKAKAKAEKPVEPVTVEPVVVPVAVVPTTVASRNWSELAHNAATIEELVKVADEARVLGEFHLADLFIELRRSQMYAPSFFTPNSEAKV